MIASYLAAHNPPKSDVRMFVKVDDLEGVAGRKGKKSKRGSKKILAGVSSKKKKVRFFTLSPLLLSLSNENVELMKN